MVFFSFGISFFLKLLNNSILSFSKVLYLTCSNKLKSIYMDYLILKSCCFVELFSMEDGYQTKGRTSQTALIRWVGTTFESILKHTGSETSIREGKRIKVL